MRAALRSIKQFRSAFRYGGDTVFNGFPKRQHFWVNKSGREVYNLPQYADFFGYRNPFYLISRGLHADVARVANGG